MGGTSSAAERLLASKDDVRSIELDGEQHNTSTKQSFADKRADGHPNMETNAGEYDFTRETKLLVAQRSSSDDER
jgi:hypothetical protein